MPVLLLHEEYEFDFQDREQSRITSRHFDVIKIQGRDSCKMQAKELDSAKDIIRNFPKTEQKNKIFFKYFSSEYEQTCTYRQFVQFYWEKKKLRENFFFKQGKL